MAQNGKRILIIEDEERIAVTIADRLTAEGFRVKHAADGVAGERLASETAYDLILLDVMLPKKNGFDILRDLRKNNNETPVIMLKARAQLNEKVVGLKLGADDYLTKPFEMLELLARIESRLRRSVPAVPSAKSGTIGIGAFRVNLDRMEVKRKGKILTLSAREFQLLRYFLEHPGIALSRDTLLNDVWGYDAMPTTRTVDTHVTWLRQKIEENPRHPKHILSIRSIGYKFIP